MIIFGVDFETTGVEPAVDRIVECGFALWSTQVRAPVFAAGFFVKPDGAISRERWDDAANACHHITMLEAETYGFDSSECVEKLCRYMRLADVACAHNAAFDKPFFEAWCLREKYEVPPMLWLDTRTDLGIRSNHLTYIAADHGFINPFPHRALTDVLTMLKILDQFDIGAVVEIAKIPNVCLQALVSYNDRDKAKDAGYYWRGKSKRWLKLVKQNRVEEEAAYAAQVGFKVQQVEKEE